MVIKKLQNNYAFGLLFTLVCVIILRLVIYQWLRSHGYFYGIPWDSFSRALISYVWSKHPFFSLSDGYWLPLQFWLVGSAYVIVRPLFSTSEILVPVFINNLFFVGSIIITYIFSLKLTNKPIISFVACILAGVYAGDVFVSYSALSEPMLIFFILLASFSFYIMQVGEEEKHTRNAVLVSIVILLAAATHYIGWFLAFFFCLYMINYFFYAVRKKDYVSSISYLFAIIVCAAAPFTWLYNNYSLFGDPFYPFQIARHAQAAFIGEMNFLKRICVTPLGVIRDFYPISISGVMAIVILLFKKPKSLFYLIPGGFIFVCIWLTTGMALSATDQEPRYLVFIGWLLVPMISMVMYYLWNTGFFYLKVFVGFAIILILGINFWQISTFRNSFDRTVQTVSHIVREWCEDHPGEYKVILNQDSFAETGVIPVISGYPDRIDLVSNEEFIIVFDKLINSKQEISNPWLYITKNKPYAKLANSRGFSVKRIGLYYLISEK